MIRARVAGALIAITALGIASVRATAQGDDDDDDKSSADKGDDDDDGGMKANSAKGDDGDDDAKAADDDGDDDGDDGGDDGGMKGLKKKADAKKTKAPEGDDAGGGDAGGDAGGDDVITIESDHNRPGGGRDDQNSFSQGRFFVDKIDSKKTAASTLFQGSFTSSNFYYREQGGTLGGVAGMAGVTSNSDFKRMFTDFRTQLDALHMAGGRWDFRFDARARAINNPSDNTVTAQNLQFNTRVQSGMLGRNELELKEMWLVRGGERTDLYFGRQYVADLGALKLDGMRFDYASTPTLTLIGFAGTAPMRGSRTIGTDYAQGFTEDGTKVSRVIPLAFGGGAAYRTEKMYGAFGGVVLFPLKGEQPRVYATANGYWRRGSQIDIYHFVVLDLYGNAASAGGGVAFTNLSVGINAKPAPRIRASASINRVDTETLNITAQNFLRDPAGSDVPGLVRNNTAVYRIASDQVRGGLSVALGQTQQIEVSTSLAYRRRPSITIYDGVSALDDPNGHQTLPASQSVEVWFGLVHRHLLGGTKVGIDGSRIFGIGGGGVYARSASIGGRLYAGKEFREGRGEWEAEIGYTSGKDDNIGGLCSTTDINTCYGSSKIGMISAGGTLYYRLRTDLLGMASINIASYTLNTVIAGVPTKDPALLSSAGFLRLAYRF